MLGMFDKRDYDADYDVEVVPVFGDTNNRDEFYYRYVNKEVLT